MRTEIKATMYRVIKRRSFYFTLLVLPFTLVPCSAESSRTSGVQITSDAQLKIQNTTSNGGKGVVGYFFDDRYAQNGFCYAYPPPSEVKISREVAKKGKSSLQFVLAPDSFSGGSICLHQKMYNVRPYLSKGAVQFWIKGSGGNEKAWVALVDEAVTDNRKTVVRVDIGWFGKITTDWSVISIPLQHFGEQGVYWNENEGREMDAPFNWNKVAEFRIESRKDENAVFKVWVDDIVIVKSLR